MVMQLCLNMHLQPFIVLLQPVIGLKGFPYKLGGGHRRFNDNGYDCSGAVSYVLIKAGLLGSPMTSNGFKKYGRRGKGDWVTIYAKNGHIF